jgi:hypothetical protein
MKKLFTLAFLLLTSAAVAQDTPLVWASRLESSFRIVPNIVYLTASGFDAKLDLYVTRTPDRPLPTLIWIHGGGWTGGTKESATGFQAYHEMGMNVVNVEYQAGAHRQARLPSKTAGARSDGSSSTPRVRDRRVSHRRRAGRIGRRPSRSTGMLPPSARDSMRSARVPTI